MLNIGVIGYGGRINHVVKKMIDTGKVHLSAIMDINNNESKRLYLDEERYNDIHYYDDAEEMLKNEKLDGICIGTRCSTHAYYAVMAAKYNIPIFLEKPEIVIPLNSKPACETNLSSIPPFAPT